MAKNQVITDVVRVRERLGMLGLDKHEPEDLMLAAAFHLHHHPDRPPLFQVEYPLPGGFTPSEQMRENMIMTIALLLASVEAGDKNFRKQRKEADALAENAENRFETVRPFDEVKIRHKDQIVFHGQVEADGCITLGNVRCAAAGKTQGELAAMVLAHFNLREE